MTTSEARILANQANAAHSTGPKTEAGKERSRQNSLKHGMTGAGVVLPEADAIEVERRAAAFAVELTVIDEVGAALARRAALNSVRMERGADQQTAALTARIRQVEADFVPPEGVDEAEADKLRAEAVRIAMFDTSREATLARKYEVAAERSFFRAIKELRQMGRKNEELLKADQKDKVNAMVGSILSAQRSHRDRADEFDALYPETKAELLRRSTHAAYSAPMNGVSEVPITIGRGR